MKKTLILLIIALSGCLNSKYEKFDTIDMIAIDSVVVKQISKQDHHSIIQKYRLNKTQTKKLISEMNNLQGGSPWKFMPEFIIEFHLKDSIRSFRTLGGKITEKNDWALKFKNEEYLNDLIKLK